MVNSALLSKKISNVRHNLSRIRTKAPLQLNDLKTDIDIQDIVLHNLQLAVQGCIDIAAHIVADQGWGVAGSINETFYILRDKKAISLEMMEKMVSMAGFRNILIHEYEDVNLDIVHAIVEHHLHDIDKFLLTIAKHFNLDS